MSPVEEAMAAVAPGVALDLSVNRESKAFIGSILEAEVSSRHDLTLQHLQNRENVRTGQNHCRYEGQKRARIRQNDSLLAVCLYPSLLSSRTLAALLGGGEVSKGSWPGLRPREGACPGLESQLSWEVS